MRIFSEKKIVLIGVSGFPYGMAAIQRQLLIAKALASKGWNVTVICNRSVHSKDVKINKVGRYENIKYVYAVSPFRSNNFLIRNIKKIVAPILENLIIKSVFKKAKIKAAIVSNRNAIFPILRYFIISKLFRFKLFLNFVEIYKNRSDTAFISNINDWLFNHFGLCFFDGYLPISKKIIQASKKFQKPYHYLPIIVDVEKFQNIHEASNEIYFLYCGAAQYFNSIYFIIKSFSYVYRKNVNLILVTNGSQNDMLKINNTISEFDQINRIKILNKLTWQELYTLYVSAQGLFLPLFDTIQDNARFPHKLAEYLASGRVVLSNPIGELGRLMTDKKNILFSSPNDFEAFAKNTDWILSNPVEADLIGQSGLNFCRNNFDYKILNKGIDKFLTNYATEKNV